MEETNSEKENHKTEIRFGICQILDASRLNYVVNQKQKSLKMKTFINPWLTYG